MAIAHIDPAAVGAWVPNAVERMAQVRVASGALRVRAVPEFLQRKTALFRVGIPRDSKVLVDNATGDWLWISLGDDPEIMASSLSERYDDWLRAIFQASDGRPVAVTIFEGETGISELPSREISQRLRVPIKDVHLVRPYDDISVRVMTAAELDRFIDACAASSARQLSLAQGDGVSRVAWDNMRRALDRLTDGVATPGHSLYSICVDSTAVGGIWAETDGAHARIWNVYIYPPYRGHSHAQAGLLAMTDGLREEGVRYLHATIMTPNKQALELHKAVGFRVTARHKIIEP